MNGLMRIALSVLLAGLLVACQDEPAEPPQKTTQKQPAEKAETQAEAAAEHAEKAAEATGEAVEQTAEKAMKETAEATEAAQQKAAEMAEAAKKEAAKMTETAKKKAADMTEAAKEKTAAITESTREKAATAEKQMTDAAGKLAEGTQAVVVPEMVTLEAKNGNISFPHKRHGQMFGCDACHTGETPTLLELDMNSGHTLCRGCHEEKGIGPTKCAGCHKK